MDKLFINLKVLSRLQPGQKIYTKDDYLVIDDGSGTLYNYQQVAFRWWAGETRDKTLKKLQEIVRSALYCGQSAINSEIMRKQIGQIGQVGEGDTKNMNELLLTDNIKLLASLSDKMEKALVGIRHLKKTYEDDLTLCAKIDLEVEMLERNVEKFRSLN